MITSAVVSGDKMHGGVLNSDLDSRTFTVDVEVKLSTRLRHHVECHENADAAPGTAAGADRLRRVVVAVAPSQPPVRVPAAPTLFEFIDDDTGFKTFDLRDAQNQIVQVNSNSELIWTADGTRLPGYRATGYAFSDDRRYYFIEGKICEAGCAFEVRFGTEDGERRAYLTVDYGHDNPGTVVDVEVSGGELQVTQTDVYPPGTPTLSGVVTGDDSASARWRWKESRSGAAFQQAGASHEPTATASTKYAD